MEFVNSLVKLLAVLVGILLILVGVRYAMLTFDAIYQGIQQPATAMRIFDEWAQFMVREMDDMAHNDALRRVENIRIVAALIVGTAGFLLAWISIQIIVAGGKIVALITSDERATRKILHEIVTQRRQEAAALPLEGGSTEERARLREIRRKAMANDNRSEPKFSNAADL
jgi:TRAP-type C4-dicarboxylate transport system permease small subunit